MEIMNVDNKCYHIFHDKYTKKYIGITFPLSHNYVKSLNYIIHNTNTHPLKNSNNNSIEKNINKRKTINSNNIDDDSNQSCTNHQSH